MKIILSSRKGFDSSAGGCPSPILPDGRLISLPIPDKRSLIRYCDIQHDDIGLGKLVYNLTRGRIGAQAKAHLDPDLLATAYPRLQGWRPVLGQTGAAQGHLRSHNIGAGDVFVFFGLFRPAELHQGKWRFVPQSKPQHIIWGWMQVQEVLAVDKLDKSTQSWAEYHPHCHGLEDANNTLYLSSVGHSGVFNQLKKDLILTYTSNSIFKGLAGPPHSDKPSLWSVPQWLYPFDQQREPLSFHHKGERWTLRERDCLLQSVARGQEFVLDAEQYPEAKEWLRNLCNADTL